MNLTSESPKITILIPVKNRSIYLQSTLETCVRQEYANLEVIVVDDFSDENVKNVVDCFSKTYSFVRWTQPPVPGGMRNAFEYALTLVTDGYVIFLGGDDGIMPNGIKNLSALIQNKNPELISWSPPIYYYPGVKNEFGQMVLPRKSTSGWHVTFDLLMSLYETFDYLSEPRLPMVYVKGAASIKLIRELKSRFADGRFFQCATPDGFSGVALSRISSQVYYSETPFTIYGSSPSSQGMAYLSDSAAAMEQVNKFFVDSKAVPMHSFLGSTPYSPLISLMTADYLLRAADIANEFQKLPKINIHRLVNKSLKEVASGVCHEARVNRELMIIEKIAQYHNIERYFYQSVKTIKREIARSPYQGDGWNLTSVFVNCDGLKISNVYDASIFITNITSILKVKLFERTYKLIVESIKYKLKKHKSCHPLEFYCNR
jgi:glycosyltransferase involved in cell wall biosynthesis